VVAVAHSSISFPDIGYFRDTNVQTQLTNILFLYATMNPHIGYRQGMHELLAPLYYAIDYDSIPEDGNSEHDMADIRELCSRTWVAADAWTLFITIMRGVSRWYEWRDAPSQTTGSSSSPFARHVILDVPNGQLDTKPYMAPIVEVCSRIQSSLLKSVDPLLWKSMQGAGIEPQIYGMCAGNTLPLLGP
jgi:TBC1 domain family protein 5